MKSSFSGGGGCVDVEFTDHDTVEVASTRNPTGWALVFTPEEWTAFLLGVRAGEFELPGGASCPTPTPGDDVNSIHTHDDLTKIRALLRIVSETDGSVTLSGESAAAVAAAIGEVEQLRSDRDRLQKMCDKTAPAAANRTLRTWTS